VPGARRGMRSVNVVAAALAPAVLSGCVLTMWTVGPNASPAAGSAYVAGIFARTEGHAFAFEVQHVATGRTFALPSEHGTRTTGDRSRQVVMIAIPEGTYRVRSWVTYDAVVHSVAGRKRIPPGDPVARPFSAAAGSVVCLSSFAMVEVRDYPTIHWTMGSRPIAPEAAQAELRRAYPAFGDLPVACLLCRDAPPESNPPASGTPVAAR